MKATKNYTSSQKSPRGPCLAFRKEPTSLYQNSFLEDFLRSFSIDLAQDRDNDNFYNIVPNESDLKKVLCFQDYHFLRYDLDKILSQIMYTLIFAGKAFVEIVISTDEEKNLVGISLVPFHPIISIRGFKNTYFVTFLKNKKTKLFKIEVTKVLLAFYNDIGKTQ